MQTPPAAITHMMMLAGNDAAADRLEAEDQPRQSEAREQKATEVEREGHVLFADVGDVPDYQA